jgi:uncharacterized protein
MQQKQCSPIIDHSHGNQSIKKHILSSLVTHFKENNRWIIYNWLNTENAILQDPRHPLYVAFENNTPSIAPFTLNGNDYSDFEYLKEKKFIVQKHQDIDEEIERAYRRWISPSFLSLTLLPVNQACDFNCRYCYEDHSQKEQMGTYEMEVLQKYIDSKELTHLSIGYFGGEPLLNSEFIREFNRRMIELAEKREFKFQSQVTTNGYRLTREMFDSLLKLNITHYQVTIDGTPDDHDRLRPLKNGSGTFHRIYENLKDVSRLDKRKKFTIGIRVNFNPHTAAPEKRSEFLNRLKKDFGHDERFYVNIKPIGNWKKGEHSRDYHCPEEAGRQIEAQYRKELVNGGFGWGAISKYRGLASHACYAGTPNRLIILPHSSGRFENSLPVLKCTVALNSPTNLVGTITKNGVLEKNDHWKLWVSDTPYRKKECRNCHFVLNCFGSACPQAGISRQAIVCPEKKYQEVEIIKDILEFIRKRDEVRREHEFTH